MDRIVLTVAALAALVAVAVGAAAAHALPGGLDPEAGAWIDTAVRYQMWHALALLGVGLWMRRPADAAARPARALTVAAAGFALGILLFCGGLYLLALTGNRALAAVVPVGGTSFLVGWAALVWHGLGHGGRTTGR